MQFFKVYGLKGPSFEPAKLYFGVPLDSLLLFNKSILDNITSKVLDGEFYPSDKLLSLVKYLERRNISVYCTETGAAFRAEPFGSSQIYWPKNPTVLQVKHELSHYLDFKSLGFDAYSKLTRYERENMVLERLQSNRLWERSNEAEK